MDLVAAETELLRIANEAQDAYESTGDRDDLNAMLEARIAARQIKELRELEEENGITDE